MFPKKIVVKIQGVKRYFCIIETYVQKFIIRKFKGFFHNFLNPLGKKKKSKGSAFLLSSCKLQSYCFSQIGETEEELVGFWEFLT